MTRVELHKTKRKRRDGSTYQNWVLRWYGSDGKRYCDTLGQAGKRGMSAKEARARQRAKQSEIDADDSLIDKPKDMTLAAFADHHAEIARGELSPGSLLGYKHAFAWTLKVIPGPTKLTAINRIHVSRLRNAMHDAGSAPPTVHKVLAQMRAAFNRAISHGLLAKGRNPFAGFRVVDDATRTKEAVVRSHAEIRKLKAEAPGAWWQAAIGLWFSGLRQEEALALQWDAVDFDRGEVTIRKSAAGSFTAGGETYPILAWQAKTRNSYRRVPVPADTMTALKALREESDGSAYCFLSLERLRAIQAAQDAGRWQANSELVNNVLRDWRGIQRRILGADVKPCTVHDCRKAFCTHAADCIPIQTLAQIVGDTPAVLMRYYTMPKDEHADKLRAAFGDDAPNLALAG